MNHPLSPRTVVKYATVRLLIHGIGKGTGFFVAPGLILTCAHVVSPALEKQIPVEVHSWEGKSLGQSLVKNSEVFLEEIPIPNSATDTERSHKYPDLALLHIASVNLPWVYLDGTIAARERLFSYGYVQDYPGGEEAEFTYEGESRIDSQRRLLKFGGGQVTYGLSGGPLLNLGTGAVCGVVQRTRDAHSDLGGRAIAVQTIFSCFPELLVLQKNLSSSSYTSQSSENMQSALRINSSASIEEIARYLQRRKALSAFTLLFLGSRTSLLYENTAFYAEIKNDPFSKNTFDTLSKGQKFQECYRVLKRHNKNTRHDILQISLNTSLPGETDTIIAELVRKNYFTMVISTSIDTCLDRAIDRERLQAPTFHPKFVVFDGKNSDMVLREERLRNKIIKIFGNVDAGQEYYTTVGNELELDSAPYTFLREYLQTKLLEDMVIVGYDPVWDRPLERIFLEREGGSLFYINEEMPGEHSVIARTIQKRGGKYLCGEHLNYQAFMKQLYQFLA